MLDVDTSVPYLLERKLIGPEAVVDGGLTVRSAARRNRNLRVETPAGGYLIKQPDDPTLGGHHTLRAEAAFYSFCQQEPAVAAARGVVPNCVYYDPERALLALELLPAAVPLWHRFWAGGPAAFPHDVGRRLGGALGAVHRAFAASGVLADPRLAWLSAATPWVMSVHQPGPELLATISPANYLTLRILQTQGELSTALDRLRALWAPTTLVHGDVKSDNILVDPPDPAGAGGAVRLVDWELVQRGDPAWDLAGVLQDTVLFWISGMNLAAGDPAAMAATAGFPWDVLRAYLRAVWAGYKQAAGLAPEAADELLTRAVAFSGARLVQTAYETAAVANAMPAQAVLLLQVSANLLADPGSAQVQFYGVPHSFRVPL